MKALIKDNPKIVSGRKNFYFFQSRVNKTLDLVKKYINSKKNKKN